LLGVVGGDASGRDELFAFANFSVRLFCGNRPSGDKGTPAASNVFEKIPEMRAG